MRPCRLLLFSLALLIPAAPASAAVPHTVQPGETLWSIAAGVPARVVRGVPNGASLHTE